MGCSYDVSLSLHGETFLRQVIAEAITQVALQLHAVLASRAARAAHALQLLRQFPEESGVARKAVDDRYRLAASAFLLHAHPGRHSRRHRLVARERAAA